MTLQEAFASSNIPQNSSFEPVVAPITYLNIFKKGEKHKQLVIVEVKKNKVIFAWYDNKLFKMGMHDHKNVKKDRDGKYFNFAGQKIRID